MDSICRGCRYSYDLTTLPWVRQHWQRDGVGKRLGEEARGR